MIDKNPSFCSSCFLACAIGFLLLAIGYYVGWLLPQSRVSARQIQLGKALYAQHCASCRGVNLEGQLNWQTRNADGRLPAPPHDDSGHTWHHSDEQLFKITKFGVSVIVPDYASDMAGFEGKMSDDEIRAVINFIKSTWSERHRNYQTERNRYQ